ncbi:MAG: hypothetical protein ACTSUV_02385 [Candidatus Ranarchaeia archaeon]
MGNLKQNLFVLFILIGFSSLVVYQFNQENFNFSFKQGNDCGYHHGFFVDFDFPLADNDTSYTLGDVFTVNVSFIPNDPDIFYEVVCEFENNSDGLVVIGNSVKQISDTNSPQSLGFSVNSTTIGNFSVKINCNITIRISDDYYVHPGYSASYSGYFVGSLSIVENPILPNPFVEFVKLLDDFVSRFTLRKIGSILGIIGVNVLFASLIIGQRDVKLLLIKRISKWKFTHKYLNTVHCWLSGGTLLIFLAHFLVLSLSSFWKYIFASWQILPLLTLPLSFESVLTLKDLFYSIDIGRIGILIMLIALTCGYLFAQISNKVGRRTAIFTQQITYIVLPILIIHAGTLGTITKTFQFVFLYLIIGSITIVILRFYFLLKKTRKLSNQKTIEKNNTN